MSRWLWALLGGVVLVTIAAAFWIANNQTNVAPPSFTRPNGGRTRAGSRPYCTEGRALGSARHLRPRLRRRRQPRPLPLRRLMQDSKPPRNLLRPRRLPRRPRLLPLRSPKRHCRRPRPDGTRRQKSRANTLPRALRSWSGPGPIPRRIASASSSGAAAAGPIGSRWTSSPRPRSSNRRRGSFCLPPSAGSRAHLKRKVRSR